VKQSHESFLIALFTTGVTSRGDQPYSFGFQKVAPQYFIARGRDHQGLEKSLNVSDL